jgi:hypothetical protein
MTHHQKGDAMIKFLKKIFGLTEKRQQDRNGPRKRDIRVYDTHDIIDYDGMGNQGRFPVDDRRRR